MTLWDLWFRDLSRLIFIQSGAVYHQIDQNVKCRLKYWKLTLFRCKFINIFRKIVENKFRFLENFDHPKAYHYFRETDAVPAKSVVPKKHCQTKVVAFPPFAFSGNICSSVTRNKREDSLIWIKVDIALGYPELGKQSNCVKIYIYTPPECMLS